MNSSGSAMKNVAQCSCGRSAVKVNWPWRLSMSTHPGGGQWGWRSRAAASRCAARGSPLSAPSESQPQRLAPGASLHLAQGHLLGPTLSDGNLGLELPPRGPASPHLPTSPAARTHAERGCTAAPPPAPASGWRHRRGVEKDRGPLLPAAGQEKFRSVRNSSGRGRGDQKRVPSLPTTQRSKWADQCLQGDPEKTGRFRTFPSDLGIPEGPEGKGEEVGRKT